MTEHKDSYKQNNWKNASTQRNYKNCLLVADRITKRVITNFLTNVKQPPTLSFLQYPNHKPEQKSCITKTLPSCFLDPDNQTPNNHIKPPKPKHPNPSTAQPVTAKENNHYLCTRTCNSSSSLTLVLLGPNTQSYTDNYGLNHYHPTPTTIFSTSPATYFSTNKS